MACPSDERRHRRQGLNKSFGDKAVVRDVSIRVEEGRITGFLGPNGAGKTTTLRLLCGLLTPDSGEGEVLGMDFRSQTDAIKRQTGYMTQRFSLYEDMTIEENLSFIARVYQLDDRRGRVGAALERLGFRIGAGNWRALCRAGGSSVWRWLPRPAPTSTVAARRAHRRG
jgi:ABC-2 type transport system ATP-binding protein